MSENKRLRVEAYERRARRVGLSVEEFKCKNIEETKRLKELSKKRKELKRAIQPRHTPPGGPTFF